MKIYREENVLLDRKQSGEKVHLPIIIYRV